MQMGAASRMSTYCGKSASRRGIKNLIAEIDMSISIEVTSLVRIVRQKGWISELPPQRCRRLTSGQS